MQARMQRFLAAMQRSHRMLIEHGPRSNEKLKVLHGWVQDEVRLELGSGYQITGLSPQNSHEVTVTGMYYDKRVDILIARDDRQLGVISVKSVASNYWQNSVNYIEQQIGETANLRRINVVYGNLFFVTNPIPYMTRDGEIRRYERIREHDIQRYSRLRADNQHLHAPDEMALGIVDLNVGSNEIAGITDLAALDITENSRAILRNELSVDLFFDRIARRIERLREQA